MDPQLRLVIVGKDARHTIHDVLRQFSTRTDCIMHVNSLGESMASIANRYLENADCDVFGFCHADCRFEPDTFGAFIETASSGAVCGMVGRNLAREYVWSSCVTAVRPVSTLDCCSVFFQPELGLRFDEGTFDGFHCYVEDLCLQAQTRGIPVVVPPAQAEHGEESTYLPAWQSEYGRYRTTLSEKWRGVRFETT